MSASEARETPAQGKARAHLDWLAEHHLDLLPGSLPGVDIMVDVPEVVASFERLRESPLSTWTWSELVGWRGLRRQRLHEVMRRRGLPPEPPLLMALERRLEADVLALQVARHSTGFPNGVVDPRLAHTLAFGARRTAGVTAALLAEREELVPRGLFALEAWWVASIDGQSPAQAREVWRRRWLELDDSLGAEGVARLAGRPPRPGLDDEDATTAAIEVTVVVDVDNTWQVAPQRMVYAFAQPVIAIGRHTDNDIVLAGGGVSRRHATLRIDDGLLSISDRETTNGVIIDGEPIRGEVRLAPGQVATLGAWQVSVRLPDLHDP